MDRAGPIPQGTPYTLKNRIEGQSTQEAIDTLFTTTQQDDIDQRINHCIRYFSCACNDSNWLKSHPIETKELVVKFIKLYQSSDTEQQTKMSSLLQKHLPQVRHQCPEALPNNVTFSIRGKTISCNSTLLKIQSSFFEKMLSDTSTFQEQHQAQHNTAISIKDDSPLSSSFLGMLNNFRLDLAEEGSVQFLEELISLSLLYEVNHSTLPLIEPELIKRIDSSNAFYLYFLADQYDMQNLQEHVIETIHTLLDESQVFQVLEAALEHSTENSASNELINCCLNHCVDQLDKHEIGDDFFQKFVQYCPHFTRLEAENLPNLSSDTLKWLLDNLPSAMQSLDFSGCEFEKLPNLQKFDQLEELHIVECNHLKDLNDVKNVKNSLLFLNISGCQSLKNINAIVNCQNLQQFCFVGCNSLSESALQALERFPNPARLELAYTPGPIINGIVERIDLSLT